MTPKLSGTGIQLVRTHKQALRLLANVKAGEDGNGFTRSAHRAGKTPSKGICVTARGTEFKFCPALIKLVNGSTLSKKELAAAKQELAAFQQWHEDMMPLWESRYFHYGAWVDQSSVEANATLVYPERAMKLAHKLGVAQNQIGIFRLSDFQFIPTGGKNDTNWQMDESYDERMKNVDKKLMSSLGVVLPS